METIVVSPELTIPDVVVLRNLIDDIHRYKDNGPAETHKGFVPVSRVSTANAVADDGGIIFFTKNL